jgi:glycosyltransferase involved in cell wall biosynthesis
MNGQKKTLTRDQLEAMRKESYELPNQVLEVVPHPLVSVRTSTYNHAKYIEQCIEGVLAQQTMFPIEYIIGEDYSTDRTREIVFDYARRYPNIIRVITADNNFGMKANGYRTRSACRGKYVALCEGDDYWTDPLKLQKQVDFMEDHHDYSLCFHNVQKLYQATGEIETWKRRWTKPYYTLEDVLRDKVFVHTSSRMFRNELISELPNWFYDAPVGDWPLLVLHAQNGKIGLIDQVMSVYRVHRSGVWSGANQLKQQEIALNLFSIVQSYLGPQYKKQICCGVSNYYLNISAISACLGDKNKAKMHLKKSFQSSFSLQGIWLDQIVMYVRLYFPRLYRFASWILRR